MATYKRIASDGKPIEVTDIPAALAMLIKPIRNKLVGQYFDLAN